VAEFNRNLAEEVDHRVRNNLSGLLGLVQTMTAGATGRDVRTFASAVEGRLLAMTQVHQMLSDTHWQPVGLRALVTGLLGAVGKLGCQDIPVTVTGPRVMVSAKQAPPLAMILQEWFTNSCKYGAHTSPAGQLMVVWAVDRSGPAPRVRLHWTETGGPPIRSDVRPSLGTQLVQSFVTNELRGRVTLKFPEEGADHVLEFPLDPPAV
jgi:two-component sensor histidine kinase